jgi:hypothetical protein
VEEPNRLLLIAMPTNMTCTISGSTRYSDPLPHSFIKKHLHQYFRLIQYFGLYPTPETKAVSLRQQSA